MKRPALTGLSVRAVPCLDGPAVIADPSRVDARPPSWGMLTWFRPPAPFAAWNAYVRAAHADRVSMVAEALKATTAVRSDLFVGDGWLYALLPDFKASDYEPELFSTALHRSASEERPRLVAKATEAAYVDAWTLLGLT